MQPDHAHRRKHQRSLDAARGKRCIQSMSDIKELGSQQVIQELGTPLDQEIVEGKYGLVDRKRIQMIISGIILVSREGHIWPLAITDQQIAHCCFCKEPSKMFRQERGLWVADSARQPVAHPSEIKAGKSGKKEH